MPLEVIPAKQTVPWTGGDVLLFVAIWIVTQFVIGMVVGITVQYDQLPVSAANGEDFRHPLEQIIHYGKHSPFALLIAFMVAVIVAPLIEEFLFRLLFQGWLESMLRQFHVARASGIAIVTVSLCFAAMHAGRSVLNEQILLYLFAATVVANCLIFTLGIVYLVFVRNVQKTDFLGTEPFFHPRLFVSICYCLLALFFIWGIIALLDISFPKTNTDPIPIFFFSLLLGTLYSRTQNILYCILLHAFLNCTSLTFVWLRA